MDIRDVSIIHHVGIVLALIWILSYNGCCYPIFYFASLIYLYQVHETYVSRLRRKVQFEERRQANQRRVLTDSETVRWLNHAIEKVWPICMEKITSQYILLPIVPWFLEKYKPWTAKKVEVQELYLGRNPPTITEMRVIHQSSDDDHLVMELGLSFLTADDMNALLAVKLRRRLGFGMWAKLNMTGMHIEGKVLVGVKFLRHYPFLGRVRLCFVEPPYFQMTVKPIFSNGIDVTEVPGVSGWLDKLMSIVFEQTLVEPNMMVVDMEKFASASTESWFSVNEKDPIAFAKVEVIEGAEMKPSDSNGLADPYVKGQLGPYKFRTKTQKKTLSPKWQEEFRIPICTWESPNVLVLEVLDKDHFRDDTLGDCSININALRGKQKQDMWLALANIKMGKLHIVVTVLDADGKEGEYIHDKKPSNTTTCETADECADPVFRMETPKLVDEFEPINIEGQQKTGIWVHHPGGDVSRTWEPKKRKSRRSEIEIRRETNDSTESSHSGSFKDGNSSSSDSDEGNGSKPLNTIRKGIRKIGMVINKIHKKDDQDTTAEAIPLPHDNLQPVDDRGSSLQIDMDGDNCSVVKGVKLDNEVLDNNSEVGASSKGNKRGFKKSLARSFKNVLNRKESNKSKDDAGSTAATEADDCVKSETYYEEPLSSPIQDNFTAEKIPIVPDSKVGLLDSNVSRPSNVQDTG